jgi:hypothetical protein
MAAQRMGAKPLGGYGFAPPALTPTTGCYPFADSASQARLPPLWHTIAAKAPFNVRGASRVGFSDLLGSARWRWMTAPAELNNKRNVIAHPSCYRVVNNMTTGQRRLQALGDKDVVILERMP